MLPCGPKAELALGAQAPQNSAEHGASGAEKSPEVSRQMGETFQKEEGYSRDKHAKHNTSAEELLLSGSSGEHVLGQLLLTSRA